MRRILKTEESLLNYAAWYAMRYFPSIRKLQDALMKKSENNNILVDIVIKQMKEYISEERIVDGLVRMYIEQSKTRSYIEQKLKLKKFESGVIQKILDFYQGSFISWNGYEQVITRKIQDYLTKNKSKKYIIGTLSQKYPLFKTEITTILNELSPDEMESVRCEYAKLSKKYNISLRGEQQKVIQKLCMKGFSYDCIRKIIKEESIE